MTEGKRVSMAEGKRVSIAEGTRISIPNSDSSFFSATSDVVKSGNTSSLHNIPWIIDSGANRHMTGSSKGFLNYFPSLTKDSVRIADGSFTPISGTGSVICTSNIKLSSVLHVPHFPVNLLFVSAITNALNCKIEFFPDHCVIQDLHTGKRIGNGRLHDGLYMLEGDPGSSISQACFGENKDVNQEIIQWHRRLGHPSFFALEKLYPNLFARTQFDSLFCDACEYAKHTRTSYPLSHNKSQIPFATIHSDVWGPTQTVSLSGNR